MKDIVGMTSAECYNMSTVYSKKLDQTERLRIDKMREETGSSLNSDLYWRLYVDASARKYNFFYADSKSNIYRKNLSQEYRLTN